jgi:uncharacterized coiled-coil protein SlyX
MSSTDPTAEDRITNLELELMYQRKLIEDLSEHLSAAHQELGVLRAQIERMERWAKNLEAPLPPNEKPPHY